MKLRRCRIVSQNMACYHSFPQSASRSDNLLTSCSKETCVIVIGVVLYVYYMYVYSVGTYYLVPIYRFIFLLFQFLKRTNAVRLKLTYFDVFVGLVPVRIVVMSTINV